MLTFVTALGAALAILIAGAAMFQDRLLYFPARASIEQMAGTELRPWPNPQDFRGLLAAPGEGGPETARGTVVVFHGNAGHAGHRTYYAQVLTALGLRVVLAEYPGYGPRDGEVGEKSLVADAEQTVLLAHRLHGEPLLLLGESLGAAVAASAAAALPDKVSGLLLITPWDRLERVAAHHYPWLPVGWLLRDRYDSLHNLKDFRRPVVIVVAELDTIVPARFGQALHAGLAHPKELLLVQAAGHNDWPGRVDSAWWRRAIDPLLPGAAPPARNP